VVYNSRLLKIFLPLQTANIACFHRKSHLSGFSAYQDGWSSKLIWISGVLLNWKREKNTCSSWERGLVWRST